MNAQSRDQVSEFKSQKKGSDFRFPGAEFCPLTPDRRLDSLQSLIERLPQIELPLTHRFTPGMYIRTIQMPRGAIVVSKIHRTQHPFVITKGRCSVWDAQNGVQQLCAGHIGITMPGTRRILYIHEDTEWTTFHATDKTTPEDVEAAIIEPHDFDREEALKQAASGLRPDVEGALPAARHNVRTAGDVLHMSILSLLCDHSAALEAPALRQATMPAATSISTNLQSEIRIPK